MKPIHIIFALLLVIAGITVFILTAEQPFGATGLPHESINGLSVGGERANQVSALGDAPYYFQIAVLMLAGALLYMGVAPHRRDTLLKVCFSIGIGIAVFSWTMLYRGYEAYLATGQVDVAFGFPVPTNWMLWGTWGSFILFDLFYVFAFRRYFLPKEDEEAFAALVREVNAEKGQG